MKTKISTLICIIVLLCCYQTIAQEKPSHKSHEYVDGEGKIFWQKQMPLYLLVSSNPEGTKATKLTNDKSEYADPMYLDTEGVNYIRSKWAMDKEGKYLMPKQEVLYEVYADGISPRSSVSFENAPRYTAKSSTVFYGKNLSVSAKSRDEMSQVENIWSSLDSQAYKKYSNPVDVSAEGTHEISFYAVDNVGNVEKEKDYAFTVDITSPISSHAVSIPGTYLGNIISIRTRLSITSEDQLSGLERTYYQLDDAASNKYYSKVNFESLNEGDHTMTYYAVDNVKNEEAKKTFAFFYDKTPPEVASEVNGDQFKIGDKTFVSASSKIKLSATDNKAGVDKVFYELGTSAQQTYSDPIILDMPHGDFILTTYGIDKVGNIYNESSKRTKSKYFLDLKPPTVFSSFIGNTYSTRDTTFITNKTLIKLGAKDLDSGLKDIKYSVNGSDVKLYSEPFLIEEEGYYKVSYTGTDQVNNSASEEFFFFVDKTGPLLNYTVSMDPIGKIDLDDEPEDINVYTKGSKLYLAASDEIIDTESIYYELNEGSKTKYSKPILLTQMGVVKIEVTSFDYLKNESSEKKSIVFFVK
jgi:hypothetical protein